MLRGLSFCDSRELKPELTGETLKMSKRDEPGKLRPVEIVIIIGACLFLLAVIMPVSQASRFDAYRIKCDKNLSEIGRAMLVYANDYDDELPRSG